MRNNKPRISNFSLSSKSINSSDAGGLLAGELGGVKSKAEIAERYRKGMHSGESTLIKGFIIDEKQYLKTDQSPKSKIAPLSFDAPNHKPSVTQMINTKVSSNKQNPEEHVAMTTTEVDEILKLDKQRSNAPTPSGRKPKNTTSGSSGRTYPANARSVLRDQLKRNKDRKESFAELMKFNLDLELAEAERSLIQVNATSQFVSKAMRGRPVNNKRFLKATYKQPQKTTEFAAAVGMSTPEGEKSSNPASVAIMVPETLKTSIKSHNTQQTVFKGMNIVTNEDGSGLKFVE